MIKLLPTLAVALLCAASSGSLAAQDEMREWTDSTGRFKVTGALIEVSDGNVLLKRTDGKLLKIPLARLSKQDQAFLSGADNPFEMVEGPPSGAAAATSSEETGGAGALWATPQRVDWDQAEQFATMAGVDWQLPPAEEGLGFESKRAPLGRKSNFHEHMHPIAVNPHCKRAVVGRTVSFGVPTPLSRLSLVDLVTGKTVHSEPVEANMRPLALLDSGNAVLMVGNGDGRSGGETKDQLQIWRFDGKQIIRSANWSPYENDKNNGRANADVLVAQVVSANKVVTISDKGHLVLWDLATRQPIWHGRLSERNFALQISADRKRLAVFDEKTLMVLNPETAEILGSTALPPNTATGWVKVAWSPDGKQLLLTSIADIRVLDVDSGEWVTEFTLPGGPVATHALSFPDSEYALLDNRLLVHLPSKIQVCEYRDAGAIQTIGGTSFIALQANGGGVLAPAKFPHPAAEQMLQKALDDPGLFLIHPGVSVAIDVSAVSGPHRETARQGLEKSAVASGYQIAASSPIKIVGSISGPKQEAVSYIAAGSYIVNRYTSTIKLQWNGKELWSTSGTNVPGMMRTKRGQSMQQALDEAGKQPNTSMFASARFPEFMQKPSENQPAGRRSNALMSSQFTMQGLVDSK